jgi:hypothetical protein
VRAFSSLYFFLQILWILDLLTRLVFSQLNYFISVMSSVHFPCRIQGLTFFWVICDSKLFNSAGLG